MTDSTVSLNIITVTLNMDTVPFLGISIVGQTNGSQENGDGGIYVGSIMKGGAVALDGRIEPGDMILEVNGISFENVSNEEAVRTLREQVQKLGCGFSCAAVRLCVNDIYQLQTRNFGRCQKLGSKSPWLYATPTRSRASY